MIQWRATRRLATAPRFGVEGPLRVVPQEGTPAVLQHIDLPSAVARLEGDATLADDTQSDRQEQQPLESTELTSGASVVEVAAAGGDAGLGGVARPPPTISACGSNRGDVVAGGASVGLHEPPPAPILQNRVGE